MDKEVINKEQTRTSSDRSNQSAFTNLLTKGLEEVEARLRENSSHDEPLIRQMSEHALLSGGKRLRARFVLTSWLIFKNELTRSILDIAAASELFHTATLLHDDVLDEAHLRRGQQTVNAKWGTRHAVLLGDFLLSRAFQLLHDVGSLEIMESFVITGLNLGDGALTEYIHKDDLKQSEETYLYIIARKTATFFQTCASSGAILANTSQDNISALKELGLNFGIAFQITDDILDVISDENTMGKPRGQDILEGNLTLPLIKYFETTKNRIPSTKLSMLSHEDVEFMEILEGLNRDGALSYSYDKANQYVQRALSALDKIPQNDASQYFRNLISEITHRKA